MKNLKTVLIKSFSLWERYEWDSFLGMAGGLFWTHPETLLLTVPHTTKPRGELYMTAALYSWWFSKPYAKAATTDPPFGSRQSWRRSKRLLRLEELIPVPPDWTAVDIAHCFKSPLWRLFTFWKKKTQIFLRRLSCHCILLATTAWRGGLIPSNQYWHSVHRLAAGEAENRGGKNNF